MKLSELIAYVGDENVQFQNLCNDFEEANMGKRSGTVKFRTEGAKVAELMRSTPALVGLVLWIPREKLPPEWR